MGRPENGNGSDDRPVQPSTLPTCADMGRTERCCGDGVCGGPESFANCAADCAEDAPTTLAPLVVTSTTSAAVATTLTTATEATPKTPEKPAFQPGAATPLSCTAKLADADNVIAALTQEIKAMEERIATLKTCPSKQRGRRPQPHA